MAKVVRKAIAAAVVVMCSSILIYVLPHPREHKTSDKKVRPATDALQTAETYDLAMIFIQRQPEVLQDFGIIKVLAADPNRPSKIDREDGSAELNFIVKASKSDGLVTLRHETTWGIPDSSTTLALTWSSDRGAQGKKELGGDDCNVLKLNPFRNPESASECI